MNVVADKSEPLTAIHTHLGAIFVSLELSRSHSRGHQHRDRYPKASDISSPPCLLRLLPAGAVAGWALHPLEKRRLVTAHVECRHSGSGEPRTCASCGNRHSGKSVAESRDYGKSRRRALYVAQHYFPKTSSIFTMITTPYEIARHAGIQWGFGSAGGPPLSGSPKFFAVWSDSQHIDLSILIYVPQVPFDPSYSFTGFEVHFVH